MGICAKMLTDHVVQQVRSCPAIVIAMVTFEWPFSSMVPHQVPFQMVSSGRLSYCASLKLMCHLPSVFHNVHCWIRICFGLIVISISLSQASWSWSYVYLHLKTSSILSSLHCTVMVSSHDHGCLRSCGFWYVLWGCSFLWMLCRICCKWRVYPLCVSSCVSADN